MGVKAEKIGQKRIPVRLTVPIEIFKIFKGNINKKYKGLPERFPELQEKGIPKDLNWELIVKSIIIPCVTEYTGGLTSKDLESVSVDEIKKIEAKGDYLCLECILSDTSWDNGAGTTYFDIKSGSKINY